MKVLIGYIVLFLVSMTVFAEGGKVGQPTFGSITTQEGCQLAVPNGVDLDNCKILFQDNQTGVTNWVCENQTYFTTCPPLDDNSPGNSGKNKE